MITIDPDNYQNLLDSKKQALLELLSPFDLPPLETYDSPRSHFRMRAEFRVWKQDYQSHYAMFEKGKKNSAIIIEEFPQASHLICDLMQPLMEWINSVPILAARLFQIDFLSTLRGEILVTLIYHKNLSDSWAAIAAELEQRFNIKLIGRARNQRKVFSDDFLMETLTVNDKQYHYKQIENTFTQPNAVVNEKMLSWVVSNSTQFGDDLLELYCGSGNFTLPLAQNFNHVLATEVSKPSIKAAKENAALNNITNIDFARLSSEEIVQALNGEREFRRLANINLNDYNIKTVFVDPPRCGLDQESVNFVSQFDNIIYISCNPHTLKENLMSLPDFRIKKLALFDQFPYTEHTETGVILTRI